jgi:hypothetical protein
MLRNQMLDPEGSPSKDTGDSQPWFTGGGSYSPHDSTNMNFGHSTDSQRVLTSFVVEDDYENEPPLLEELGIRFDHIQSKTLAVLYPRNVSLFLIRQFFLIMQIIILLYNRT